MTDVQLMALDHESQRLNNEVALLMALDDKPGTLAELGLTGESLAALTGESFVSKIIDGVKRALVATRNFILIMWRKFIGLFSSKPKMKDPSVLIQGIVNSLIVESEKIDKDWQSIKIDNLTVPVTEQNIPESNKAKIAEIIKEMPEKQKEEVIKVAVEKSTKRKLNKVAELALLKNSDLLNELSTLYQLNVSHSDNVSVFFDDFEKALGDLTDAIESKNVDGIKKFIDRGWPSNKHLMANNIEIPSLFPYLPGDKKGTLISKKIIYGELIFKNGDVGKLNKVKSKKVDLAKQQELLTNKDVKLREFQEENFKMFEKRSDKISNMFDIIEDLDVDKNLVKDLTKAINKAWSSISGATKVDMTIMQLSVWVMGIGEDVAAFHSARNTFE